jgi:uncharacterized protein YndB with AHSA1/START domain
MASFTRSIAIRAPVEHVWTILADLERWPEWTASMRSVRALGDTPLGVGARYRVEQPKLQPAEFTISDWRPPHSFTWKMGHRHSFRQAAGSPRRCRTAATQPKLTLRPRGGAVGVIAGSSRSRDAEAEGLKRRAEAAR